MKSDRQISIDRSVPLAQEPEVGHNRWHPDLSPVLEVAPGEVVAVETRDAFDGQFTEASDTAAVSITNGAFAIIRSP